MPNVLQSNGFQFWGANIKKVKFLLNSPQRPILHRLIWITVKHHLTICVPFPLEDSRLSLLAG